MEEYKGSNNSGISGYEILENGMLLKYKTDQRPYLYDYLKPGRLHVENMKELAKQGEGLSRLCK